MTNPAALYYPHVNISDKNIIKNSLLLWDQVEYITPSKNWEHIKFESKIFNEAIELISKPHYPSDSERREVHKRISNIVKNGLPPWFFVDARRNIRKYQTYTIYPEKLDYMTWELLKDQNLAQFNEFDHDFHASPYFGLMIMSLLADACAGQLKRKITDRAEAYSWLQKYITVEAGGEYITGLDVSQVAPAYERLVTISIKLLNTDDIPIRTLVAMRKREEKSSSSDYREFRIKYLNKVDEYVEKISKAGLRETDIKELERLFQKDMAQELKEMRKELNLTKDKLLWSKEVAVSTSATAGALTTQITGLTDLTAFLGAVGVGALVKAGKEFKAARRKALKSNSMSWLYLAHKKASRFDPRKIIL